LSAIVSTRPSLSASTPASTPVLGLFATAANTVSRAAWLAPLMVAVGAPLTVPKPDASEPRMLPPANARPADALPLRSPPNPALLPATMEFASVVEESGLPYIPPPPLLALLPETVALVSTIEALS
jgi:hypothetical protein